jgi:hypothetical protein
MPLITGGGRANALPKLDPNAFEKQPTPSEIKDVEDELEAAKA